MQVFRISTPLYCGNHTCRYSHTSPYGMPRGALPNVKLYWHRYVNMLQKSKIPQSFQGKYVNFKTKSVQQADALFPAAPELYARQIIQNQSTSPYLGNKPGNKALDAIIFSKVHNMGNDITQCFIFQVSSYIFSLFHLIA